MSKKIKMSVRAANCARKGCRGCSVGVHADDYVNGQRTIETKGVAHPTIKNIKVKGHEGSIVARDPSEQIRGVRKSK